MRNLHRFLPLSALVVATLFVIPALAQSSSATQSASSMEVTAREQADGSVGLLVTMPPEALISPNQPVQVAVTVGTDPVPSRVLETTSSIGDERVLLLTDASGSMQGARLRQVRQAVDELLATLDPSIPVGLGTFADDVRILVPPTTDRQELSNALAAVRGDGDTALFSALLAALQDAAAERIVVLTDGEDTASSADADDIIQALANERIPIDVIALDVLGNPNDALARVVDASGGATAVTPQDLAETLRASVTRSDAILKIGTDVPWTQELNGQRIDVQVTDAAGQTFLAGTTVLLPTPVQSPAQADIPVQADSSSAWWASYLLALGAFAVVSISALAAVRLTQDYRNRTQIRRVLSHYSRSNPGIPQNVNRTGNPGGDTSDKVLRFLPRTWADALRLQVDNAGLPLTPTMWLLVQAAIMIAVFGLLSLAGLPVVVALLGLLLCGVVIQAIIRSRIESARRQFDGELADFFTLVASGLRSGLSLAQAVAGAAHGGGDVLARQMRRVTTEVALGMDLADALDGVAVRMSSADLALAVQAVRIQRETGGSLSNVLDIAATTVRQRAQLQREVRALSAEGRVSALILMVLPVAIFAFFFLTRREYVEVFWTEPAGWIMLGALALILSIGAIWMQRVTKIDI